MARDQNNNTTTPVELSQKDAHVTNEKSPDLTAQFTEEKKKRSSEEKQKLLADLKNKLADELAKISEQNSAAKKLMINADEIKNNESFIVKLADNDNTSQGCEVKYRQDGLTFCLKDNQQASIDALKNTLIAYQNAVKDNLYANNATYELTVKDEAELKSYLIAVQEINNIKIMHYWQLKDGKRVAWDEAVVKKISAEIKITSGITSNLQKNSAGQTQTSIPITPAVTPVVNIPLNTSPTPRTPPRTRSKAKTNSSPLNEPVGTTNETSLTPRRSDRLKEQAGKQQNSPVGPAIINSKSMQKPQETFQIRQAKYSSIPPATKKDAHQKNKGPK